MQQINLFDTPSACSGCGACLVVCPKDAITMETGPLGCTYPVIDEHKCIRCGRCMRICAFRDQENRNEPLKAYAALGRCDDVVKNSASGGVFASIAGACLTDGVQVAGAVMTWTDGQADVKHILTSKEEDILQLQGSKYVQSRAWDCYEDVLREIKAGKPVLFSGTPCQVAAIKKLTGNADNLVTMDLVCHGTPSQKLLNEAAIVLAKRLGGRIDRLIFRDKSIGKQYCTRIDTSRKGKSKQWRLGARYFPFYQLFLDGDICRDSCYDCPYAAIERISDITMGDYWGIRQFHGEQINRGEMPNREDWSCVLVNTMKGQQFLERYGSVLHLYESESVWIATNNSQLKHPSRLTMNRQEILSHYHRGGYKAVESWYIHNNGGWIRFFRRMYKSLYKQRGIEVHK